MTWLLFAGGLGFAFGLGLMLGLAAGMVLITLLQDANYALSKRTRSEEWRQGG